MPPSPGGITPGILPSAPAGPPALCFGVQIRSRRICRTHEGLLTLAGFQDQCIQPLCHLSRNRILLEFELVFEARKNTRFPHAAPALILDR